MSAFVPRILLLVGAATLCGMLTGCVLGRWFGTRSYDSRSYTIQTFDLFNQRTPPRQGAFDWKGDWIFRRERLELVDQGLQAVKPDILMLQSVMQRRGSPSESDRAILSAGALDEFEWSEEPAFEWEDTDEVQTLAIAFATPLKGAARSADAPRNLWTMGADGFLFIVDAQTTDQPITLVNVQMPSTIERGFLWYSFVLDRISEWQNRAGSCSRRLVIGGHMPATQDSSRFLDFMNALELKDSGEGFCDLAQSCFTATPDNNLFAQIQTGTVSSQADRILVHRNTAILNASRIFTSPVNAGEFTEVYGVARLFPSTRYGWSTSLRLARCD